MSSISDPFILPKDVILVPVHELSEQVRSQFSSEEGDIAITRPHSRTPTKIINPQAAELLAEFRSGVTIAEAVRRFAEASHSDPKRVLESAFPLIQLLINTQLLLPVGSPNADQIAANLEPGTQVGDYQISYCVQVLQDTEIYQAYTADRKPVAIKIARPQSGPMITFMLAREAAILHHLQGKLSPALLSVDEFGGRHYLALEWIEGISAIDAAEEFRKDRHRSAVASLLQLCCTILAVYADLHDQGVIHGDIHPNNILVGADGRVKLIDFGLANFQDPGFKLSKIHRGGVAFFFDPELAQARLSKQLPPPAQPLSEQYSLAVLLYYLLTGFQYLNFTLEEEGMLRQIAEDPPISFSNQGLPSQPAVENVLWRALAKDPSRKFNSLTEMATQLKAAAILQSQDLEVAGPGETKVTYPECAALYEETLDQLSWQSKFLKEGLPRHPHASIFYGAGGVAYALYRMACLHADPSILALADAWSVQASTQVDNSDGFYNAELDLSPETIGRISPYHTASGIYVVQALISQAMGDIPSLAAALHAFANRIQAPCDNLDLTLGRSSVLLSGALLFEMLPDKDMAEQTGLRKVCQVNLERIWDQLANFKPIRESDELPNLGIAHGWAGILYATMRWCQASQTALPPRLDERLAQLADCVEWVGRGGRWPWRQSLTQYSYMSGWCNGSAGFIFAWTQAHKIFKDAKYLEMAEKAAWNSWEDPAEIANLCCGLAGRSYGLLHFYNYTGEQAWLMRAQELSNRGAISIRAAPLAEYKGFENSLYKGELGVALLSADLACPKEASFPFFESEHWDS